MDGIKSRWVKLMGGVKSRWNKIKCGVKSRCGIFGWEKIRDLVKEDSSQKCSAWKDFRL